jgi:hypothetical protein
MWRPSRNATRRSARGTMRRSPWRPTLLTLMLLLSNGESRQH